MKVPTLQPRVQAAQTSRVSSGGSWRDDKRGSTQRGYNYQWQQARKQFLQAHPLCQCEECDEGRKRLTIATVVDHHVPHRGNHDLFWNQTNWRAMSKQCHDRKTGGGG